MSICVVLWSPRTLFVKSTLHERPLYWTLYCGDMFKIACLWIQGKITASISSSFCILEIQGVYRAGSAEHPNNPALNEQDLLRRLGVVLSEIKQLCCARSILSFLFSSTSFSSLISMKMIFIKYRIHSYKCVYTIYNTLNTSLYIYLYIYTYTNNYNFYHFLIT